ncbi:MAG TPA: TetR/AcrR family transcriptional regulator [Streptosporangiaceae bacterium]|jgi:AcrR family transcriptional regulator
MTRTKPAEQRRADLLAAGQALFVAKGITGTSLEDITNGAGVSKGLFYLYFRSKEDMVLALQEQFSGQLAERVRAAACAEPDWARKLDACVLAAVEYYRDRHDQHEVLFHHAGHTDRAHGPSHGPLVEAIRELLEAGVAADAYRIEDPATTAVIFYAIMHAFDHDMYGGSPPADDQLTRATQQLFRRAAAVPDQASPDQAATT